MELQTHCPFDAQIWPAPHAGWVPQPQAPLTQALAKAGSQALQVAPAVPHCEADGVRQLPPGAQQPFAQEVASQTQAPARHRWPAAQVWPPSPHMQAPEEEQRSERASQAWHAAPLMPQCGDSLPRQWVPSQQPAAQEVASQMQAPPRQR